MVCRSLDVAWPWGKGDAFMEIADPRVMISGRPAGIRRFNCLRYSQNVAALWLKYGAKSLKSETFQRCKILFDDATIC
jgi:hypothetical protein